MVVQLHLFQLGFSKSRGLLASLMGGGDDYVDYIV